MAKNISGRELVVALKKAATWRTAVAVGAGDGILITEESLGGKEPNFLEDDSMGLSDIMDIYQVSESATGKSLGGYLRYEGWDTAIALAMGTAGTPDDQGSNVYSNAYYPADNIDDLFATIAMKKADATMSAHDVWEVPSAKILGFTIEANIGELAKITINFSGNKIETESPANNATSMAAVTYPTSSNIARLESTFEIRMNNQGGIALAAGDKIYPYGFTLTYSRPPSEDFSAGNIDMDEPAQDGFAESSIELRYDKYNIETFMDTIAASSGDSDYFQKMDIKFTGDECGDTGSGSDYMFNIYLPKIKFTMADAPASGPGKIAHNISGKCMKVDTAPTGFDSNAVGPVYIEVQNTRGTDPLA